MALEKESKYFVSESLDELSYVISSCKVDGGVKFLTHYHLESRRIVVTFVQKCVSLLLVTVRVSQFPPRVASALQEVMKGFRIIYSTGLFLNGEDYVCELVIGFENSEALHNATVRISKVKIPGLSLELIPLESGK